jgi:hypothetical protein
MTEHKPAENDSRHHTLKMKDRLDGPVEHLREDTSKFDEPKAQAMFETAAEVLLDFEKRSMIMIAGRRMPCVHGLRKKAGKRAVPASPNKEGAVFNL